MAVLRAAAKAVSLQARHGDGPRSVGSHQDLQLRAANGLEGEIALVAYFSIAVIELIDMICLLSGLVSDFRTFNNSFSCSFWRS